MIWLDIGLINMANKSHETVFEGNFQGRLMEQIVGQTLAALGVRKRQDMFYWAKNRDEGSAEVDFCFQYRDKIIGLEVKSGTTAQMKSLFSMLDEGGERVIPIRISWNPPVRETHVYNGKTYSVLTLPFYLLERWESFV